MALTQFETDALKKTLEFAQEIKLNDTCSIAFNGNEYVIIDGYGVVREKFDTFFLLLCHIEDNDLV